MCGISGIYSSKRIPNIKERIISMNDSVFHRGPDAGDYFVKNNLGLGHRRLSIIDTSERSNQPMVSNSTTWHIIFNGEIYNFKEIKKKLNYTFKTNSDTEVILAAVENRGINWFVENANGMFAIALYNENTKKLFLIRDRLGIKPLYYFIDNEKLIFSSEIKSILSSGLVKAIFNEFAVDEYLANRFIRAPYTFFKNIFQLKPGHYIEVSNTININETKYWDLPSSFNMDDKYDEEYISNLFNEELVKAIKYRLVSDVPLGTYLSGGVDSSLITAITCKLKRTKLNTYTIGFREFNEFEYSKIIAKKYNTSHHEILMKKDDYLSQWENLIRFKDAPLGVPNEIPLALMSTKLKKKITVVLSGEGADELMGGYGKIFRSPFDFKNHSSNISFYEFFINQYEYVSRKMRDKFLSTPFDYRVEFDNIVASKFSMHNNEENVFRFFHKYHVKGLLQRVDTTTMQASVEARVPFLDHNLINFVYENVPYNLKLKWKSNNNKNRAIKLLSKDYSEELDIPKYLLRKISYDYIPHKIIERKKVGFPVPLTEWFSNLEDVARQYLLNASWLKKDVFNDLLTNSKTSFRSGQVLWMFINVEIFKRQYFEKNWKW